MAILNELLMSELAKLQESVEVSTGDYSPSEVNLCVCAGNCKKICASSVR
jgi:hypothetical protein